jgi:hypothetical protein
VNYDTWKSKIEANTAALIQKNGTKNPFGLTQTSACTDLEMQPLFRVGEAKHNDIVKQKCTIGDQAKGWLLIGPFNTATTGECYGRKMICNVDEWYVIDATYKFESVVTA